MNWETGYKAWKTVCHVMHLQPLFCGRHVQQSIPVTVIIFHSFYSTKICSRNCLFVLKLHINRLLIMYVMVKPQDNLLVDRYTHSFPLSPQRFYFASCGTVILIFRNQPHINYPELLFGPTESWNILLLTRYTLYFLSIETIS